MKFEKGQPTSKKKFLRQAYRRQSRLSSLACCLHKNTGGDD